MASSTSVNERLRRCAQPVTPGWWHSPATLQGQSIEWQRVGRQQQHPSCYRLWEKTAETTPTLRTPTVGSHGRGGRCPGRCFGVQPGAGTGADQPSAPTHSTGHGAPPHPDGARTPLEDPKKMAIRQTPEHVESTHKPTTENDFNFQEQIIATPTQPQTKYFQANLY